MEINWLVRIKNPLWWAQIICAIILPVLAYFGLNWQDMTTWEKLWHLLVQAIQNPVVAVSMIVSVINAINDPTTAGIKDSARALTYAKPYKDGDL